MALQGPIPVEFGVVFPSGAYAAGAFEPVLVLELVMPGDRHELEDAYQVG